MPSTAATAKKSPPASNAGPAVLNAGPSVTPAPRPIAGDVEQIRAEHDYCERPRVVPLAAQPPAPVAAAQAAPIVVAALW